MVYRKFKRRTGYRIKRRSTYKKPYVKPFYKKKRYLMYKSPRMIMPQEYVTTLRFSYFAQAGTGASMSQNIASLTSDAYDVSIAWGNHEMPGFDDFARFYSAFRTLRMGYKITACNQELFAVNVTAVLSNQNVVSLPLGSPMTNSLGNPNLRTMLLGPSTGDCKGTIKLNRSIVDVYGTRQPLYDDKFQGSTSASTLAPDGMIYLNIWQTTTTLPVNGVYYQVQVALTVLFHRPIFQVGN